MAPFASPGQGWPGPSRKGSQNGPKNGPFLDHFGVKIGQNSPFWTILGASGALRSPFGPFGPKWVKRGYFRRPYGPLAIWAKPAQTGPSRFGPGWPPYGSQFESDPFWTHLDPFGPKWPKMVQNGPKWSKMTHFDPFWTILGVKTPDLDDPWVGMGQNGLFWPFWAILAKMAKKCSEPCMYLAIWPKWAILAKTPQNGVFPAKRAQNDPFWGSQGPKYPYFGPIWAYMGPK